jgi:hypothetical protein
MALAAEPLPGRRRLSNPRQCIERLRDLRLQEPVDISCAHWSQVRHSSNRSIAGATIVALARPTAARLERSNELRR